MAKERINPEFNIQRVVQPTANPVDIYYRPNLGEPEPSRQLQIVKALQELNPQLQRLSSDAMSYMISKEKDVGALEAMQDDEATIRRKQAEYVEKAGGIAPWRFQTYLEKAGARLVRDKYQKEMYSQLDDLSEPFNADGTLRDPSYVKKKMDDMYAAAGIPETSYYMIRGAAAARASVDDAVLSQVEQMRVKKVKEATDLQLEDDLASVLETTMDEDLPEAMAEGGRIKDLLDSHYKNGFGSGREQFTSAMVRRVDGLTAERKFDQARAVIGFMMSNPVAGGKIGARNNAILRKKLEDISDLEERHESAEFAREERRVDRSFSLVNSSLRSDVMNMSSGAVDGYVSLTTEQMVTMVDKKLQDMSIPDADRSRMRADLVERLKATVATMNQPLATNPRVARDLEIQIAGMSPEGARLMVDNYESIGLISPTQADQLTKDIDERSKVSPVVSAVIDQTSQLLSTGAFSGASLDEIESEYRNTLIEIGSEAAVYYREDMIAWARQPENLQKAKNDPMAFKADAQKESQRLYKEISAKLRTDHDDEFKRNNKRIGFEHVGKTSGLFSEVDDLAVSILDDIPFENKLAATDLRLRVTRMVIDRLREEYKNAPPGLTTTEKGEYLRSKLPDIGARINSDVQDGRGIPTSLHKTVQAAMQKAQTPAPAGVRAEGTQVVGSAIQGAGWFGSQASTQSEIELYNAGSNLANFTGITEDSPEQTKKLYAEAKSKVQETASSVIKDMVNTTAGSYRRTVNDVPGMRPWWSTYGNIPAFVFRDSSIYTLPNSFAGSNLPSTRMMDVQNFPELKASLDRLPTPTSDQYTKRDDSMTAKYWAAKAVIGYTQDEVKNGKTSEGLAIADQYRDPDSFLYFQSQAEYDAAVAEYNNSDGKSGYIAEVILPKLTGVTADRFGEAQVNLLRKRKPN